jgi:aspartyl-tRNA(Asn)/glutamyl-tRNA(Gln) amidotransferase subunit A
VDVVPVESDIPRRAAGLSLLTMLWSSARQHASAVRADPAAFGDEVRALLTLGEHLPGELLMVARTALSAASAELFARHRIDVLVMPTTACVAPPRDARTVEVGGRPEAVPAALTRFTAWASAAGLPGISVPVPTAGPLPSGVQVVAPPFLDHRCLALAALIEAEGGLSPRP